MQQVKPMLIPAKVPWSISTSAPHLKLHQTTDGKPSYLTFIGYFKLNETTQGPTASLIEAVGDPGEFRLDSSAEDAPYRMVRIILDGGVIARRRAAASDHEVIPEAEFDWHEVPGFPREGEGALANMIRTDHYWKKSGYSPDPGFYEVEGSPWVGELGINDPELRHYIAVGQDEYFDIIARNWRWGAGQKA